MFAKFFPSVFPLNDPVLIFAIVLVLFLTAPMVMKRFNLPGMIGLLLAGAILGPHALGILARDSSFILLGAVGLTYIMFTAALEIDLTVFKKYGVSGFVFGMLTFAFPQGLGTLVAYYILGFDLLPAILLASMLASHTLLAYPIASKHGLSTNRAVTATVGGTIITDTLALLVLAVVASYAQGDGGEALWWRLGFFISTFVAGVFFLVPHLGRWFFKKFPNDDSAQFVFVLSSVFMCAALAHFAGLEPIVGAFLSGLALNKLIPHNSTLMNRLNFTGDAIFIPFFLLSVGMILDVTVLFKSFRIWWVSIIITLIVIGTKWAAAKVAGLIFRYKNEETQIMFGLSVVQAAATLATVMVGHRIGMFDDAVVNAAIITILVTCILGPYVVDKYAAAFANSPTKKQEDHSSETSNDSIIIPVAPEQNTPALLELSLLLRNPKSKAPIYPTHITADNESLNDNMAEGKKLLNKALHDLSAANCPTEAIHRVDSQPEQALIKIRKEVGASKIVMGWDARPSEKGAQFGTIIDALVTDGGADLIISKLAYSLSGSRRINLVFAPFKSMTIPLIQAAKTAESIAKQLGVSMQVMVAQDNLNDLKNMFKTYELHVSKTLVTYPSGRTWFPFMIQNTLPHDLIILLPTLNQNVDMVANTPLTATHSADSAANSFSPNDSTMMAYSIVGRYSDQNLLLIFGAQSLS